MSKGVGNQWVAAGGSRADVRVGLVREGRVLAGASGAGAVRAGVERGEEGAQGGGVD